METEEALNGLIDSGIFKIEYIKELLLMHEDLLREIIEMDSIKNSEKKKVINKINGGSVEEEVIASRVLVLTTILKDRSSISNKGKK